MKTPILIALMALATLVSKSQTPCGKITTENDEIRGFVSFDTPFEPDYNRQIWITKIKEPSKKPTYYIHIREFEPLGKSVLGAYLVLANGKKIVRPNLEINVEIDKEEIGITHQGYIQQADFELSPNEILALKSAPISKYAFSYLSNKEFDGKELYEQFLCLLTK